MYNGTGRTVVINAIDILKRLLMGQRLRNYLVAYISINSELSELSFEFSIQIDDVNIHVYYDVELARNKVTTDSNADNIDFIKISNVENTCNSNAQKREYKYIEY